MTDLASGPMAQRITDRLTAALLPTRLDVSNDSAQHRGHMGDDGSGETHFSVTVESAAFAGLSRVARQRLVNHALAELMEPGGIHALAIRAKAAGRSMRAPRPAARILLIDGQDRVLLFRFTPYDGRPPFWCTPGGKVDAGETYEQAARRELLEEVGLDRDCGPQVTQRTVDFLTIEGVEVTADERWFRVDVDACDVTSAGHTELERRVMQSWRWFTADELATLDERVYPDDLAALIAFTDHAALVTASTAGEADRPFAWNESR